ncbi:1481_t:CDS:1 [Acaulospora colombiana]|uniref:1481_t:CDS:1 n=1 Tax=Acaulospora colombiana TaxID=27376 RepID=A0ACA9L1A3_9GLOM|nr:1481_t:CDS:1 [Acaulospora colombiana]
MEKQELRTPIKGQSIMINNKRMAYEELETPLRELTQANFILTPKITAPESPLFIKRLRIDSEPTLDDEEGFELILPDDTLIDSPCARRTSLRSGKPSSLRCFTPIKSNSRVTPIPDSWKRGGVQPSPDFFEDSLESPSVNRNSPSVFYILNEEVPSLTQDARRQFDSFNSDPTNIFLSSSYDDVQSTLKGSLVESPLTNRSTAHKENLLRSPTPNTPVTRVETTPNRTRDKNTSSPEICDSAWISRRRMNHTPLMLRKMAKIMQPSPAMVNEYTTKYAHMLDRTYFEKLGRNSRTFRPPESYNLCNKDYFTDHFTVESILGIGEFSIAYKVTDRKSGILYAVKKAKNPFKSNVVRSECLEEVEIMWKLGKHPNCIQLFSAWEQRGHLHLQTELCENGSLEYFLNHNAKLEESQIWRIFADIAFGLEHIHECNIMHLDLKPGNIFQALDGTFKIGDFGLSASWPAKPDLDRQGDCRYISLEALNCRYDKSADIYSLGAIVLEMTGIISLSKKTADRIRLGDLSGLEFERISCDMSSLLKAMLQVDHRERPKIQKIVKIPKIRNHRS